MSPPDVQYAFDARPGNGDTHSVADGIRWLRMPLPFALNHINLWLVRDTGGWAIVDTGLGDDASREHWETLLSSGDLSDPLTRVLVTHMHPDHVGGAGYLARRFGIDLWMAREEYLLCRVLVADTGRDAPDEGVAFYRAAGYPEEALARYRRMFGFFGRYVTPLPETYHRLADRQIVTIGGSPWEVVVGRGHSPEHACLFDADRNIIIGGDMLLPAISANVSVYPTEPRANPLREWLESLAAIRGRIPADVLVLPAHGKPYFGAHARIDAMIAEHRSRLDALLEYCAEPRRAIDVFPALYRRDVNKDNLMFATGEALAHLNYLVEESLLRVERDDGIDWYRRT